MKIEEIDKVKYPISLNIEIESEEDFKVLLSIFNTSFASAEREYESKFGSFSKSVCENIQYRAYCSFKEIATKYGVKHK